MCRHVLIISSFIADVFYFIIYDNWESWPQFHSWKNVPFLPFGMTSSHILCPGCFHWDVNVKPVHHKAPWNAKPCEVAHFLQLMSQFWFMQDQRQSFIVGRTLFVYKGSSELLANWECIKYWLSWRERKPQNLSPEGRTASKQGLKTKISTQLKHTHTKMDICASELIVLSKQSVTIWHVHTSCFNFNYYYFCPY